MTRKEDILNELTGQFPRLANISTGMPYHLPEGYWTDFPEKMVLTASQKAGAFSVPEGYFENFASLMLNKVKSSEGKQELSGIAPFLNTLPKEMPYFLPEGYFENLLVTPVVSGTSKPARVISMASKSWKRWAAAAAVLISLGIGWQYFSDTQDEQTYMASLTQSQMDSLLNTVEVTNLNTALEKEDADDEFTNLLLAAQEGPENSVQKLSTEELTGYLENYNYPEPGS